MNTEYNASRFYDFSQVHNDSDSDDRFFSTPNGIAYSPALRRSLSHSDNLHDIKNREISTNLKTASSLEHLNKKKKKEKFVSVAEQVLYFQKNTPDRFRSKPKVTKHEPFKPLKCTIPQSPMLLSKQRARNEKILSSAELEMIEFEEIQKMKFKALTLNEKIFKNPSVPPAIEKKQLTRPEPFNLTEVKPKMQVETQQNIVHFVARPVPNFDKPISFKDLPKLPLTVPKTPNITKVTRKQSQETIDTNTHPSTEKGLPKCVKVQPFSFELRDKMMIEKKERKIKEYLEEEKRAREFHANPAPKFIKKHDKSNSSVTSSCTSDDNTKSQENILPFKARPAAVLKKKPFVPVKPDRPLIEVTDFVLNTDIRMQKREEFERMKKETLEQIEEHKKLNEQILKQKEQEEVARIRRETVHKANPIRNYKQIIIKQSDKKLCSPQTPKFHQRKKNI